MCPPRKPGLPYQPAITGRCGCAGINPTAKDWNSFDELRHAARGMALEEPFIAARSFDKARADEHRNTAPCKLQGTPDEFLAQPKWWIGDNPIGAFIGRGRVLRKRKEIEYLAKAVVLNIATPNGAKILRQRRCHITSTAGRLPTRAIAEVVPSENLFNKGSRSPFGRWEVV